MSRVVACVALLVFCFSTAAAQKRYDPVAQKSNEHVADRIIDHVVYVPTPVREESVLPPIWHASEIDEALALAADKDFPDTRGIACWRIWRPAAAIMDKHPLPKTPVTAADFQVYRLVSLARTKLKENTDCEWLSAQIQKSWGIDDTVAVSKRRWWRLAFWPF